MAGLYIHIPFCKSRCIYCGFYSTTATELIGEYTNAICKELELRKEYLHESVSTIYFGGGTPSLLSLDETARILNAIYIYNKVEDGCEITMECNPDDVTTGFAKRLAGLNVNRVSMGVQSFSDNILAFARRRHKSEQIRSAIENLREAGIKDISIDLMFGFPNETISQWNNDIEKAIKLNVEHISAYSLMYEEGTALYKMLDKGAIKECSDDTYLEMYNLLIDKLNDAGYEHYEISNFAKPGFRSRHNSSYWHNIPYLGAGAAAHSYNQESRQWNISNLKEYIRSIEHGIVPYEDEVLSTDSKFDDYIMTSLRTCEGIDINYIKENFSIEYYEYLRKESEPHIKNKLLTLSDDGRRIHLTRKGLFLSDGIMSDLMHV